MSTIIDEFVIKIGLDPKNLTEGQKKVIAGFKKTQEEALNAGKAVENSASNIGQALNAVQTRLLGVLALFAGASSIKQFTQQQVALGVETANTAKILGTTEEKLTSWRNAIVLAGGSAEGATATIRNLVQGFQEFAITGQSPLVGYFRGIGVEIADANGKMRKFDDIMHDAAEWAKGRDPAQVRAMMPWADEGMVLLALKGGKEMIATLEKQKELGTYTKEQAEQAKKIYEAWARAQISITAGARSLLLDMTPNAVGLLKIVERIGLALDSNRDKLREKIGKEEGEKLHNDLRGKFGEPTGFLKDLGDSVAMAKDKGLGFSEWMSLTSKDVEELRKKKPSQTSSTASGGSDVDKLMAMGWTREQATGMAANIHRESAGKTDAVGDGGNAYGLAQWHPDRQAAFKNWAGKDIRQSTRDEQLAFMDWELRKGGEQKAGAALMGAKTAGDAASIVSQQYERPADRYGEAAARARLAETMYRNDSRSTSSSTITVGQVLVNTPATDGPGVARDFKAALERSSFATQANSGQQ